MSADATQPATSGSPAQQPGARADITRLERFHGMRLWNLQAGFSSVWSSIVFGSTSTGYLLALGGSNALVGLLSGANSWGNVLQLIAPLLTARLHRRKLLCTLATALGFLMWLLVGGCAFLPSGWPRAQLVICFAVLGGMFIALGSPAAQTWLFDLVPADLRGRFIARQQSILAVTALAASVVCARIVDAHPAGVQQIPSFQLLYVIAVVFGLISIALWLRVAEPPMKESSGSASLKQLALPFRNTNFRYFTYFVAVRTLAMMVAAPFFTVYMLNTLHMSYLRIAVTGATAVLGQLISNPFWGYLADKFGYRPLLRISTFGMAVLPFPWFFATPENCNWVVTIMQMWSGIMGSGLAISQYNMMLKTAPEKDKAVYVGVHTAVVNGAIGIGGVIGGLLADGLTKFIAHYPLYFLGRPLNAIHMLFLISPLLRLLGLSLLTRVHEKPEVAASRVMREFRRGNVTRTLWHTTMMQRSVDPATRARAAHALGAPGNVMAVDELIVALHDSDRTVRREAAASLGIIADERAVEPLIALVADPVSDASEAALTSLGQIGNERCFWALAQNLDDPRAEVRRTAAEALATAGGRRAISHLRVRLESETDPSVLLVVADALTRCGNVGAVHVLRRMLTNLDNDDARKQLASSIGNILGEPGEFYRLLEQEPLHQEAEIQRLLTGALRRFRRQRAATSADRAYMSERLLAAQEAFAHEQYTQVINELRLAASRALRVAVQREIAPDANGQARTSHLISQLVAEDPVLRANSGFLYAVWRASRTTRPGREEALLAVFATAKIAISVRRRRRDNRPAQEANQTQA